MKTTITVYKTKDDSGAYYFNSAPKSKHHSLRAAVKSAGNKYGIYRDSDNAEFIVTKKNTDGSGAGYWTDTVNEQRDFF